jgi:hypothetical protein
MLHLLAVLFQAFAAPRKHIELLSPTNATQLKTVFFSGDPWLVQCGSQADLAAAAVEGGLGAHEVVELALPKLAPVARVGLLDCAKKLPSGKSTLDRFRLDSSLDPTLLLVANGQTPVQLTPPMLTKHGLGTALFPSPRQQAAALTALVKARSEKKALSLTKSEHLHEHCLKRKYCALLLLPRELSPNSELARVLHKLLHEFRHVAFTTLNAARYEFSLQKHLPQPTSAKQPQLVGFKSTTVAAEESAGGKKGKGGKKAKPALSVGAKAHRGEFALGEVREFLTSLSNDQLELTALKKAPTIRWRKQEKGESKDKGDKAKGKAAGGGASAARRSAGRDAGAGAASGKGRQRTQPAASGRGKPAASGASSEGEVSDEVRRRQKMAEEEEEYMRSMFGDADDEPDGDEEGSDDDAEEEEMVLDFDEEEGGSAAEEEGGDEENKEEL